VVVELRAPVDFGVARVSARAGLATDLDSAQMQVPSAKKQLRSAEEAVSLRSLSRAGGQILNV
jgi:hypothetical protein